MTTQNLHYKKYYNVKPLKLHINKTMTICITQTKNNEQSARNNKVHHHKLTNSTTNSERVPRQTN